MSSSESPLNPSTVLSIVGKVIGISESQPHTEASSSSSTEDLIFKSSADVVVALFHSALLSLGFRFIGLGESDTSSEVKEENEIPLLLPSWNLTGDTYSFRYRHSQSSFTFLVKAVKIAKKLVVHGMAIEDGKIYQLELDLSDFMSADFPYPATKSTLSTHRLEAAFTSMDLLSEILYLFKINIVQKLIPGLHKPGYEESTPSTQTSQTRTQAQPERYVPRQPPPDFDPLRDYSRPSNSGRIPHNPYSIGDADLDPFAASPGLVPPGRFGPIPGSGGGGMYVGPNHPMFQGGGYGGGFPGPGQGFLPPGSVPQGARFDPIGPFGPRPGYGNIRPSRGPGGFGTGGMGPFSGDPDNDELPPPGSGDMFL